MGVVGEHRVSPAHLLDRRGLGVANPLPPSSGLQGWYRPDDLASAGSSLQTMPNKVSPGTNNMIATGTLSNGSVVANAQGGRKSMHYTAFLPKAYHDATGLPDGSPPFSEWIVFKPMRVNPDAELAILGGAGSTGAPSIYSETNGSLRVQRQDTADIGSTAAGVAPDGSWSRVLFTWDASNNFEVFVNNVSKLTANGGAPAAVGTRLGAHCGNTALLTGNWELLEYGRYDHVLSSTERTNLDNYIKAFFGL